MPRVKVNDIEMYHEVHGEGTPLVIINGYSGTSEGWEAVAPLVTNLSKHFMVITQDNRGAGRSTISETPLTIKLMADDIIMLLESLGLKAAHFIGNSMGGMIAQEIALNYPEKVLGLVLSATTPGGKCYKFDGQLDRISMVSWMYNPPKDISPEEMMEKFVELSWSPEYYTENKDMLNSYVPKYPTPPSTLKRQYGACLNHDTYDRLESISAKTLIIHGGQDGLIFPDSAHTLAKKIPNSELFLIEDARHGVLEEKWSEIYPKLTAFLSKE
jgi:3-oxoadipate enol-lactonase